MCKSAAESCYLLARLFNWIVSSRFLFMSIDKRWLNVQFFFSFLKDEYLFIFLSFNYTCFQTRNSFVDIKILRRKLFADEYFQHKAETLVIWTNGFFGEFWKINFLYCGRKFCFVLNTFLFFSLWWFFYLF
jgi:hypothetical protein